MKKTIYLCILVFIVICSATVSHARVYESSTGRFLQDDPKWDTNLYNYVGNSPINHVDPLGNDAVLANENNGHLALYIFDPAFPISKN